MKTKMNADYLLKILNCCDTLSGFHISADYFKKDDRSVNLSCSDAKKTERSYSDGSLILSLEFEIKIRLSADEDKSLLNRTLINNICTEVSSFGKTIPFPENSAKIMPIKIEVTDGATLISDDIHSTQYKIKFKIFYLQKKRG